MRFLADENLPRRTILLLRADGHDIEAMSELAPSTGDEGVLEHARRHNQVLITFDRDFGELVYRRGAPVPTGIVYLRVRGGKPKEIASILLALIKYPGIELAGRFTVVDTDKIQAAPSHPAGLNRRAGTRGGGSPLRLPADCSRVRTR